MGLDSRRRRRRRTKKKKKTKRDLQALIRPGDRR
jgi:hypothetical protein